MKKLFIIASVVIGIFSAGAADICACTAKVRLPENEYPPLYMVDNAGKWHGLYVELLEALLKEAGCEPVYPKYLS